MSYPMTLFVSLGVYRLTDTKSEDYGCDVLSVERLMFFPFIDATTHSNTGSTPLFNLFSHSFTRVSPAFHL